MKKTILSIILIFVVVSLTGCHDKPKDLPQDVYDASVAIADAVDSYLAGKMSFDDMSDIFDEKAEIVIEILQMDLPVNESIKTLDVSNCIVKMRLDIADLTIAEVTKNFGTSKKDLKKDNKELKRALNK